MRGIYQRIAGLLAVALFLGTTSSAVKGDCSLVFTGNVPLPDLGAATYKGFPGGLYPNGSNTPPAAHQQAGLTQAAAVVPLNAAGVPDERQGLIGLISIGLSNTTIEFSDGPTLSSPAQRPIQARIPGSPSSMAHRAERMQSHGRTHRVRPGSRLPSASRRPASVRRRSRWCG